MIVRTLAEVGRFFGVSPSTVAYWRKRGLPGPPWDLSKITIWIFTLGVWRSEQARDDVLQHLTEAPDHDD